MDTGVEKMEQYLFDLALYSDGVMSVGDLLSMPMNKIKLYEERLSDKIKKKAAREGKGKEML